MRRRAIFKEIRGTAELSWTSIKFSSLSAPTKIKELTAGTEFTPVVEHVRWTCDSGYNTWRELRIMFDHVAKLAVKPTFYQSVDLVGIFTNTPKWNVTMLLCCCCCCCCNKRIIPHSGGTLFNFLQNVSRKKRSLRETFCKKLKSVPPLFVTSSECWALFRVENHHLSKRIIQ